MGWFGGENKRRCRPNTSYDPQGLAGAIFLIDRQEEARTNVHARFEWG